MNTRHLVKIVMFAGLIIGMVGACAAQDTDVIAVSSCESYKKELKAVCTEAPTEKDESTCINLRKLVKNICDHKVDVSKVELVNDRVYRKKKQGFMKFEKFPSQLKCETFDYRMIHGCIEPRFFQPNARIYFDRSTDKEDEVDIFDNGNLNINLDLISVYWPWRFGKSSYYDSWSWGPIVGVGIGKPGSDAENGTGDASDSPIGLFSYGMLLEYRPNPDTDSTAFGFEIGEAQGYSTNESFGRRIRDDAIYAGIRLSIPTYSRHRQKPVN